MANRRERGFSMIEGIVGTMVVALSITALSAIWVVMFRHNGANRSIGVAAQLARGEIERAKLFGADNIPTGIYTSATQTGLWTGVFDPTANSGAGAWVTNGVAYYDVFGTRLSNSSSTGAALGLQMSFTDSTVLASGATGYLLQLPSRRTVTTQVTRLTDGSVVFQISSILVEGGL